MFILVTSDSDFTPLVIKLRERGAVVIGIGDNKASKAFVSSCNEFKYFDYLVDGEKSEEVSTTELTATIKNLVIENGVEGKIQLSMLGNQLINLQSDFDPRRYGAKSLSKLISALKAFKIVNENDKLYVVVAESLNTNEINTFIKNKIEASKNKKISLPEMKKMLEVAYPGFNSESYGFSRFGKFIDSFDDLELDGNYAIISK